MFVRVELVLVKQICGVLTPAPVATLCTVVLAVLTFRLLGLVHLLVAVFALALLLALKLFLIGFRDLFFGLFIPLFVLTLTFFRLAPVFSRVLAAPDALVDRVVTLQLLQLLSVFVGILLGLECF